MILDYDVALSLFISWEVYCEVQPILFRVGTVA